jgi:hypothetical protein
LVDEEFVRVDRVVAEGLACFFANEFEYEVADVSIAFVTDVLEELKMKLVRVYRGREHEY